MGSKMAIRYYQFLCDNCSYKRITDGSDIQDLKEIKTAPVPKGSPKIDPEFKPVNIVTRLHGPSVSKSNIIVPDAYNQKKKFKCPKCGFAIRAKQIKMEPQDEQSTNSPDGSKTGSQGL